MCERCGGKIGCTTDRGCGWDAVRRVWVVACSACKRALAAQASDMRAAERRATR